MEPVCKRPKARGGIRKKIESSLLREKRRVPLTHDAGQCQYDGSRISRTPPPSSCARTCARLLCARSLRVQISPLSFLLVFLLHLTAPFSRTLYILSRSSTPYRPTPYRLFRCRRNGGGCRHPVSTLTRIHHGAVVLPSRRLLGALVYTDSAEVHASTDAALPSSWEASLQTRCWYHERLPAGVKCHAD